LDLDQSNDLNNRIVGIFDGRFLHKGNTDINDISEESVIAHLFFQSSPEQ